MHYICNRISTDVDSKSQDCDLLSTNCTNGEAAMFRHFLKPHFSKVSFYFGKVNIIGKFNTINRKVNTLNYMNAKQRTAAKLAKIKRNEDILSLYSKGTTLRNMAELLDVSQATIFRVLADNGVELKDNRHFTNDTITRAIELYNEQENSIKYIKCLITLAVLTKLLFCVHFLLFLLP